MSKRYLFVDGEHLRHNFEEQMEKFFGEVPAIDYEILLLKAGAEKLFFYDSVDELADEEEIKKREAELARIQETPNCHVRKGSVRKSEKKTGREQKQVDVRLAVEMLTHGFRRNFDEAVLLTGDLDFKPAVDSLIDLGSRVQVWYARGHGSDQLLAAADIRRELTLVDFFKWSEESFRDGLLASFPRAKKVSPHPIGHNAIAGGSLGEKECTLYRPSDYLLVVRGIDGRSNLEVRGPDREKINLFMSVVYGDVTWSNP
jgi:uncharacterized LabA/DUF88 family protein